jgi:hypothetical protein
VFPSWTDNKALRGLNDWWKGAKLNLTNANLTKTEFNLVVVEVKSFKVPEPSSLLNLVLEVLLDGGDVLKPKTVRVDK